MPDATPVTWAKVELMGHVALAGKLSEEEKFGSKLGRLDIPTQEQCACANSPNKLADLPKVPCEKCKGAGIVHGFTTQYFGGGSVYRITIVSEEVARHLAKTTVAPPVSPWDFPKQVAALPAPEQKYGYQDFIENEVEFDDDD